MTSRTLHSPSADPRDDIPYAIKSQITKIAYSDPNFTTSIIKRATDFALASAFHAAIQNTPLESFTISNSKIGEDASLQLRECLSTNVDLAILHISSSVITPTRFRRIVQGLGKNAFDSNLTELTFTDCALTERCGQLLSEHLCSPPPEAPLCKNLAILDLSNNQLSDRGAIGVSYLLHPPESRLVRLSLSKNRISSDGAAAIAAALTDNKFLHSLDFSYNLISANGGIALATLLSRNKYISSLLLAHNRIGSAAALKFYEVLSHEDFKSMSTLDISNNNIGDAGGAAMQKLADEKKNVGTLIICGNKIGLCDCKLCVLSKTSDSSHWSYNVGVEENVFVEIDENGGLVTTVNAGVDDGVDWEALEEEERKKEWAAIAPKIEVENKKLAAILAHEEEVHRKRQEEIEFEKGRAEREFKAAEAEKKRLKEVEERKKGLNKKVSEAERSEAAKRSEAKRRGAKPEINPSFPPPPTPLGRWD